MCGIFAVFNYNGDITAYRRRALELSKRLRHRGPDWSGCIITGNNVFCHERLSIIDVYSGAQPIVDDDKSMILVVNGEIYNHDILRKQILETDPTVKFSTHSDCEVILHLYKQVGTDVVNLLDGDFSFVLYDVRNNRLIASRDPIGVTTLYYGFSGVPQDDVIRPGTTMYFASEMKALQDECDYVIQFPPGYIFDSQTGKITRWYCPKWLDSELIPTTPVDFCKLRTTLERAVVKRLMSDVPFGILLSGGLDSSLVAAIVVRQMRLLQDNQDRGHPWPVCHTFSIGLTESPDICAAREVAKYLSTYHHEYTFTLQEGLDAVVDIVYHLETYDVTTIRASIPMYLLSRKIKATGVKMVLSGEGSDEIFGGYLYFHQAPSKEAFHKETVARVTNLHTSDCLRANKSTMAWGLEARVPFLDKDFLDVAMTIDPQVKMGKPDRMEKFILRKAFDEEEAQQPYLPPSILWRQKEQFSDGVGYSWIDSLKAEAEKLVSDEMFETRFSTWPHDTPSTKEACWYRTIFDKWYPQESCSRSVVLWVPRKDWGCSEDPSGRSQKAHNDFL